MKKIYTAQISTQRTRTHKPLLYIAGKSCDKTTQNVSSVCFVLEAMKSINPISFADYAGIKSEYMWSTNAGSSGFFSE